MVPSRAPVVSKYHGRCTQLIAPELLCSTVAAVETEFTDPMILQSLKHPGKQVRSDSLTVIFRQDINTLYFWRAVWIKPEIFPNY